MYPQVVGEFETVSKICKGFSIARFGDGELKVLDGHGYTRTRYIPNQALTDELRRVIKIPHPKCLIGIWTMDPKGDKFDGLIRHTDRWQKFVNAGDGNTYYSSLMTRPDAGTAWMETHEYYKHIIKIWQFKRRVCVVAEPESKLLTHVRMSHADVIHVACPMYDAYDEIDRMQAEVRQARPDIVLLSIGVCATVLAYRLTHDGFQAVDLGSIGGFLMRWRTGQPKPKNRDSYSAERENGPDDHA